MPRQRPVSRSHHPTVPPWQATNARENLAKLSGLHGAVWVVSPLQRAIQTFVRACPFAEQLHAGGGAPSPGGPSCSETRTAPTVVVLRFGPDPRLALDCLRSTPGWT